MQKSSNKLKFRSINHPVVTKQKQVSRKSRKGKQTFNTQEPIQSGKFRLLTVWAILIAAGLGLAVNLYNLQIIQGEKLTQRARNQQMVSLRSLMQRRLVVDRNSNVLAVDRPVYTVYAHPKLFDKSQEEIAQKLGPIINKDAADLIKTFQSRQSGIVLIPALPEEIAARVIALRLNGLELIAKYSRLYPQAEVTSDVVGYVDLDGRGQAGVEYSQEKLLQRSVQKVRLMQSGNGELKPDNAPEGFFRADDLQLQLTIDTRLQRAARAALKAQVEKFQAKRGAVIVMDALDGSLLTLVSQPTYDPNEYGKAKIALFRNWTVADLYEPGSTFKPLNVAIALENGAIQANDTFNDSGNIRVGDRTIKNAQNNGYGRINIAQILQNSSNIGMVQIIQKMRPSVYYSWLERLGLGQTVETDLPFVTTGTLKSQQNFISTPIEPATASFGQGFSLTPLQLVQLHGALANGGKLVTPHIVRGLVDSQGKMHYSPTRPAPRQIFSPKTAQQVVEMMETVVSTGTGKPSRIDGYRIGGKTGTAQKASPNGGYIPGARITSFVAVLPVEAPRYVILAIVDEPKGENAYGSTVAAPIVKSVMETLIPLEKLPPPQVSSASKVTQ